MTLKKTVTTGHRLVIHLPEGSTGHRDKLIRLYELQRQVEQQTGAQAAIDWDQQDTCALCGGPWTELTDPGENLPGEPQCCDGAKAAFRDARSVPDDRSLVLAPRTEHTYADEPPHAGDTPGYEGDY